MENDSREMGSVVEIATGPSRPSLEIFWDYWRVITKHKTLLISLTLLIILLNGIRLYRQQSVYFAQADVEIRPGRLAIGEQVYESNLSNTTVTILNTQMTVAKSRAVAENVVKRLGEQKAIELLGLSGSKEEWPIKDLVDVFLSQIQTQQVLDTLIISLGVESASANSAAELANVWAQGLIDFNRDSEIQFSQSTSEALARQAKKLQESVSQKEAKLSQIAGSAQVQVLDQQLNVTLNRLEGLNQQLLDVQKEIMEKRANVQRIKQTNPEALNEVMGNTSVQSLVQSCSESERDYEEQSKIFKPDWPGLQQLRVKKDQACNQRDREIQNQYKKFVEQASGELYSVQSKESALKQDFNVTKTAISELNNKTSDYQSLKSDLENERELLNELLQQKQTTDLSETGGMQSGTLMRIVESAIPPARPIRPMRLQSMGMSLLVGLVLSLGVVFLLNFLNVKVHSHEDIEKATSYRFLTFIPDMEKETHVGMEQNAFRYLTKHLSSTQTGDRTPRIILVTSPEPKEGKTFISSNLALAEVAKGRRTLLIDTDIHRPSIHGTFQVPVSPGFADLLMETGRPDFSIFPRPSANITIVPAGDGDNDNLASILEGSRFPEILRYASEQFDYIIVDSGPVLVTPETLSVAQHVDGVILVLRNDYSTTRALKVTSEMLNSLDIRVIGTILNRVNPQDSNSFYHYYRRHAYAYYGDKAGKQKL